MISKTKISKRTARKTNASLKELIMKLKKKGKLEIANMLVLPRRKAISINIEKLNKETKEGEFVIVPGKVLGKGKMQHNITLAALSLSEQARQKLKNCKIVQIEDLADRNFKILK